MPPKSHGLSQTKFYYRWEQIKFRCRSKRPHLWAYYGGKGIKLMWKTFDDFRLDMYQSYLDHVKEYGERETTIDRIDSCGNYCKENCRWVTNKQQQNNKSNNHFLEKDGERKTLSEWSDIYGFKPSLISGRILKGWPKERLFEKPHNTRKTQI
jgi:hypothetical protein